MTLEPETLDKMVKAYWTYDGSEWAECDEEARAAIRDALVAAHPKTSDRRSPKAASLSKSGSR